MRADNAVWEEYGFDEAEKATFEAGGKRYTTIAWRVSRRHQFDGCVSVDAALGRRPAEIVSLGVECQRRPCCWSTGNYVLQWEDRMPTETGVALCPSIGCRGWKSRHVRFLSMASRCGAAWPTPNGTSSAPASLAKFEPRISPSLAGFHFGAEAQLGRSRSTERTWFSSC